MDSLGHLFSWYSVSLQMLHKRNVQLKSKVTGPAAEPKRPYEIKAGKNGCHTQRGASQQPIAAHLFPLFQTCHVILSLILPSSPSFLSSKTLHLTPWHLRETVIQITGVRKKPTLGVSVERALGNASFSHRATELFFLRLPTLQEGKAHTADSAQADLARNLRTPAKTKRFRSSHSTQLLPA